MTTARRDRAGLGFGLILALAAVPVGGASAEGYGFDIDVSLTPRAAARLAAVGQKLTVSATYFGMPTRASRNKADEMGQIDLGGEQVVLPGPGGRAHVGGRALKRSLLHDIAGEPSVNVNVFSVLPSGPANILDCGLYEGPVAVTARAPQPIRCKLIGEGR